MTDVGTFYPLKALFISSLLFGFSPLSKVVISARIS
jgi:hypothetical protein